MAKHWIVTFESTVYMDVDVEADNETEARRITIAGGGTVVNETLPEHWDVVYVIPSKEEDAE